MGLVINNNLSSLSIVHSLSRSMSEQKTSFQRIASGERITSAAEDPAGLSIAERLRKQIRSLKQAERNTMDAASFAQVAEGAMTELSNGLIRLRELGIQAASDTVGENERASLQLEAESIIQGFNHIAESTTFNGIHLLNGSVDNLTFQVGTENSENDRLQFDTRLADVRSRTLGVDGINLNSLSGAEDSLGVIDEAFGKVLSTRATLGAIQNRLLSENRTIQNITEQYTQARSNIMDTDLAQETYELVKSNILQQAGIAVLAQANQAPAQALKLL
ncbi:MAG: flagellin [Bdellovibrionia bacterium]